MPCFGKLYPANSGVYKTISSDGDPMYKLVLNYKGRPSLVMHYRGQGPIRMHANRQRAIYRADSVAVFDKNDKLLFTVRPTQKPRKPSSKQRSHSRER
jgi:hypothetical protein